MASEAQRGVVFTLKAQTDGSVGANFNAIAQRAAQLQAMLGNMKLGGLDVGQFATSVDQANAKLEALQKRSLSPVNLTAFSTSALATAAATARSPIGGGSLPSSAGPEPTIPPQIAAAPKTPGPEAQLEKLKGSFDQVVNASKAAEAKMTADATAGNDARAGLPDKVVQARMKMATRIQQFEEKQAADERAEADAEIARLQKTAATEQKAADAAEKAHAKEVDRFLADEDKKTTAAEKAAAKDAANAAKVAETRKRALDKQVEADQKYWDSFVKFGEEATEKRKAEEEKAAEAHERAVNKVASYDIRLRRSLGEIAASATEVTRGFVEMGLIGEHDMDALKDKILGVQAAVDLVTGSVKVWNAVAESVKLYHERLEAAKKAAEALAAVKAVGGVAGGVQAAGAAAGVAGAAGSAGGGGGLVGLVLAANPATLAVAALAAAALAGTYALHKYADSLAEAEKKAADARKRELEARESQNAALLQIFQAERTAREQMNARENVALKVSHEFGPKRAQYEAEADRRGLTGPDQAAAREKFMGNQAAIDQTKQSLEQVERELAEAAKMPERSRQEGNELPATPAPKEEPGWLQKISGIFGGGSAMAAGIAAGGSVGATQATPKEEAKTKAAEGPNRFGASGESEKSVAETTAELTRRKAELELQLQEQKRQSFRDEAAALNDQLQKQQELLSADKQRVAQAREYAQQTHKALDDALAGFASLSKSQQQRALRIQEKLDKGEKLTRKELEDAPRLLGARGQEQARQQSIDSVSPEAKEKLFGREQQKANAADQEENAAMLAAAAELRELAKTMQRISDLNARAAGGEKAQVHLDAKGHATVQIKWDEPNSKVIADAMKPALEEWRKAIQEMLEKTVTDIRLETNRTLQRRNQTTAAGA